MAAPCTGRAATTAPDRTHRTPEDPLPGATVGAALSGDVVSISIAPVPEHVRTARLVSGSVARLAGLDDDSVEELKTAVGEATTRAVELHVDHARTELVDISLSWERGVLTVTVGDRGPAGEQLPGEDTLDELAEVDTDAPGGGELALALVQGLVDDMRIDPRDGGGTLVTMRWPVPQDSVLPR